MGSCSLQHVQGSAVHFTRALPARYVPPSGFGYPLGGLLPPSPGRFCFTPAALLGFALRSFLLPEGTHAFPRGRTHIPLYPSVIPPPKRWAGPTGRGFWALTLSEVPGGWTGINSPTTGCSHGLHPPRAFRPRPCPSLHPDSSHALLSARLSPCRRRLGVSISTHLTPLASAGKPTTESEQPLQGSCTSTIPHIRATTSPGYGFTAYRAVHYCRLADNSWASASLYRSCPGVA